MRTQPRDSQMEPSFKFKRASGGTLLISCGALAKGIVQIIEHNHLTHIDVQCLSPQFHHRPTLIPKAVEELLVQHRDNYQNIYVVYGDCGTAGALDQVLEKYQIERIPGPHCFSFYEGNDRFSKNEEDVTSFFLTDFFCKNFEKFIWKQYALDRHETMLEFVFGHYKKLVYIAQTEDPQLKNQAMEISKKLGLEFEYRYRAYGDLENFIQALSE